MAEPAASQERVLVIGGGWAGISAAVELSRQGVPVTLLEAARQLGGRARCVAFDHQRVDNGQHLMVGAYTAMLRLLEEIGVTEEAAFLRQPLELHMRALRQPELRLRARNLPAPFHLAMGLATARGLSPRDRLQLMRFSRRLLANKIQLEQDITVQALLLGERQGVRVTRALWEPLCLAALNTGIAEASALLFLEVLQRTFSGEASRSDLLIPRQDLGVLLPEPAMDYIERHRGRVELNRRIESLQIDAEGCQGVTWRSGHMAARKIILAAHPVMCRRLLSGHSALQSIAEQLGQLRQEPITTIYLRYPDDVDLGSPMQGLQDGLGQWIFDRRIAGHPGLIAVVISGRGEHLQMDNPALGGHICMELARLHPDWPAPLAIRVLREKRATFAACADVARLRPGPVTPVPGLFLAGDFTDTGLPATLEGAVISGQRAAAAALS
ncbi:MAG: hydroxysqualene dehydroxylase HpnE [Gammaproteobacteria bacterium]|nr:hydroxysqualene dehydroxylase HpnE [Gammaproteobacteria bacterium]